MYKQTSPIYQKYQEKDGTWQLKKVGETNHYQAIQSHREEVDMYTLLKKAQITGDYSNIEGNAGVYADIADFPRSFNDAQRLISSMPDKISKLPAQIRDAFDNYSDFVNSVVNGTTNQKIFDYYQKLETQKVEVTE